MTDEQYTHLCDKLDKIYKQLEVKLPDFDTITINDLHDWKLDYRGYRYIYLWIPGAALNLSFGDYGSGIVQPLSWVPLDLRPGTVIKTIGQGTTLTPIHFRFSDVRTG